MNADQALQEISDVNRKFEQQVGLNRNFAAIHDMYSEDARILPPGADMIAGRDHIRNFWDETVNGLSLTGLKLNTIDVEVLGDTAFEIGAAELHSAHGVSPTLVWKRQNGGWRWHVDIWNAAAE